MAASTIARYWGSECIRARCCRYRQPSRRFTVIQCPTAFRSTSISSNCLRRLHRHILQLLHGEFKFLPGEADLLLHRQTGRQSIFHAERRVFGARIVVIVTTHSSIFVSSSAVSGADGITAMEGLVDAFMAMGGFALQINVLDPAVLKKAQQDPEKYKNLQVRLCGWNVRFVDLKKHEQDEFIRWSSQS